MSSLACRLHACLLGTCSAVAVAAEDGGLALSGYYKNLLLASYTMAAAGERYETDLNRLRLELKGSPAQGVALDLQYDNEVLLGSYLRTAEFALQKSLRSPAYWRQYRIYADGDNHVGRHRMYRASVTLSAGDTDVRIGRQRIAWGTGRFWSPLDLLNPFSAVQLEREERIGADAALIERKFGPLSRLSGVYADAQDGGDSSAALRWHDNRAAIDYSLVAGSFAGERVLGADLATQIGDAGLRAELTGSRREDGSGYRRALLGIDYAYRNTLTLSGELYYNGAGAADPGAYDFAALLRGEIQNVGRRYFGGYAGYEITPLLKWVNYLVVNLGDHSRLYSPGFIYSLRTNVDLTLGAQFFHGGAGSEYAPYSDVYYGQLQWFF